MLVLPSTHIPRYYRTWPTATKFKLLINTNSEIKTRNLATLPLSCFQKEKLTKVNISCMYHYVNMYHAFHVLFMRFMLFNMYYLWR